MAINGQIGSLTHNEERARVAGHDPVVLSGAVKPNDGVYPTGLLLTKNASSQLVALVVAAAEVIETGDGATKAFTGSLANAPVEPGTATITDGVETFADDGCGRLSGDAGGSGTINYKTGAYSITFNANVVNLTNVTAGYVTAVDGVLDTEVDTSLTATGIRVVHGTVDSNVLKVGKTASVAPSAAVLALLQHKGIYPI